MAKRDTSEVPPGFHELVSNLCYKKKPTAFLVSACAAVAAKPQPRRVFPGCLTNNSSKGKRGQDGNSVLWCFITLSAANFLFLHRVSTFSQSMFALYLVPTIHTLQLFSTLYSTTPSIFALTFSFLSFSPLVSAANRQAHSLYPLCIFTQAALPRIRTHYCQLCHLWSPESQKEGGWGSTMPMKLGSVCICRKQFITFWILPQSTMFNYHKTLV